MEQPRFGDGEDAWRRFAGELRERMRAVTVVEARAAAAETRARAAEQRLEQAHGRLAKADARAERQAESYRRLLGAKYRDGSSLDQLEELLQEGDVPGAVDLLAERRAGIEEARGRDEERRRLYEEGLS